VTRTAEFEDLRVGDVLEHDGGGRREVVHLTSDTVLWAPPTVLNSTLRVSSDASTWCSWAAKARQVAPEGDL